MQLSKAKYSTNVYPLSLYVLVVTNARIGAKLKSCRQGEDSLGKDEEENDHEVAEEHVVADMILGDAVEHSEEDVANDRDDSSSNDSCIYNSDVDVVDIDDV